MILTPQRAELISDLRQPGCFLLRRRSELLPPSFRKMLTGSMIVRIENDQEIKVKQTLFTVARGLVEAGYLVKVGVRPMHGELYALSESSASIDVRQISKSRIRPSAHPKILRVDVEAIAAKYGCSFRYVKVHKWFELTRLDGKPLKIPCVAYKPDGSPLLRLSDMSLAQWEEAIKTNSEWIDPCVSNQE